MSAMGPVTHATPWVLLGLWPSAPTTLRALLLSWLHLQKEA